LIHKLVKEKAVQTIRSRYTSEVVILMQHGF